MREAILKTAHSRQIRQPQLYVTVNGNLSSLFAALNVAMRSVPRFTLCAPLKSARHLMDLVSRDALACNGKEYLWSVLKSHITPFWPLRDYVWNAPCTTNQFNAQRKGRSAVYDSRIMILSWGHVKYLLRLILSIFFSWGLGGLWQVGDDDSWVSSLVIFFILVVQCTKFTSLNYTSSFSECRHNLPIKASEALWGKVCFVCLFLRLEPFAGSGSLLKVRKQPLTARIFRP